MLKKIFLLSMICFLNCNIAIGGGAGRIKRSPRIFPEFIEECKEKCKGDDDCQKLCLCYKCWSQCVQGTQGCQLFCKCEEPVGAEEYLT